MQPCASNSRKIKFADGRLAALGGNLLELQQALLDQFRTLARERVDYIASDKLMTSFDAAEQQVQSLLEQRKTTALELSREIEGLEQRGLVLENLRSEQADALERVSTRLDDAEAETQRRLDADPDYQAQRDRAAEAGRIALHADDKASRSEQEQEDKGQSYQDDPLFMYLWQRHYGTTEYHANPLARMLDRWVAGLTHYGDAQANYKRLQELPLRLRDHADRSKVQSNAEYERLKAIDAAARAADGITALEEDEAAEQKKLEAIDADIETQEQHHQQLLERRERFAAGKDREYLTVIDFLSSEFSRDDIQQLRREALATPYPEDDVIVARILDADREKRDLEHSRRDMKQLLQQHRARLKELEATRAEFKRRRYDHPRSEFADGALVGVALNSFLQGMLKSDSMWDVLQKQQRPRRGRVNPDFGSGGLGRGTMWGGSAPGRKRGGSSGGFRTGGGF